MKYLLDTCVISDGAKPRLFPQLAQWLQAQSPTDLAISSLTVGELRYGIQRLLPGRKREQLKHWLESELLLNFADRVVPVDVATAEAWGLLRASGEEIGRPLAVVDGLLLATAHANGLTFVTRNLSDVENRGVSVFSPY